MSDKNGGKAFPRTAAWLDNGRTEPECVPAQDGMDLRDWFAGKALAAIIQTAAYRCWAISAADTRLLARTAYKLADAMIAQREGREDT